VVLNDAAPLYRNAPEAKAARASGIRAIEVFMREALPKASKGSRALAGNRKRPVRTIFLGNPSL
jgi:hypothetical protein